MNRLSMYTNTSSIFPIFPVDKKESKAKTQHRAATDDGDGGGERVLVRQMSIHLYINKPPKNRTIYLWHTYTEGEAHIS